jgi:two-component system CheB/CheR fusion protein
MANPVDKHISGFRFFALLLGLGVVYFVAARLGLSLAYGTRQVSAVWPPTGIALAAVLLFGNRVWPAIFVGALAVNAISAEPLGTALGIALGNTLEALFGAYLLRRFARFGDSFAGPRDALTFIGLGAVVAPIVSATIGSASLCLGHVVPWSGFDGVWRIWWLGDALGALVITPLLLSWYAQPIARRRWWLLEAVALTIGLTALCVFAFATTREANRVSLVRGYQVFPFVLWAAFRFGMRGVTTATFIISILAVSCAVYGLGPFQQGTVSDTLVQVQVYMAVVAFTGLVFGTMAGERTRAVGDLRNAFGLLEQRVATRTAELARTNQALRGSIAEHQETLQQLRRRDVQFAEAQRIGHIGSWEWNTATDAVTWSDELYRLYGLEPQSLAITFAGFLHRVHPEDRDLVRTTVGRAFAQGAAFGMDHRTVWPDGSVHWLHGQGRVVKVEGAPVLMSGTSQDITRRKENEEVLRNAKEALEARVTERTHELAEANRALQLANRTKDEFLATLAHELRNPLAPIRNAVEIMKSYEEGLSGFARLRAILERQVENMVRLIDELLDISRVERGKIVLQTRRIDVSECVRRAIETCGPMLRENGHMLQTSIPEGTIPVTGDPLRLEQVLVNLLMNAIKYTPHGGSIRIAVEQIGDSAVLRVRDSGVGIDTNLLDRVFDLFVQGQQGLDRSRGGLGIGLTLVRKLVELHGGSVHAWSEGSGKGSEFVISLPLAAPEAAEAVGPGAPAPARAEEGAKRILVIEDHEDSRESMRELLAREGHEVFVAANGPAGVELALAQRPDFVFVDIGLPGMNGYEVCEALHRELEGTSQLVALTGYGDPDTRLRATAVGFHMVLAKPASFRELKEVLAGIGPPNEPVVLRLERRMDIDFDREGDGPDAG